MLVAHHMFGKSGGIGDGRADQTVASQPLDVPVPEMAIMSEVFRHQPPGNALLHEPQRIINVLGKPGHVGHHEAGP